MKTHAVRFAAGLAFLTGGAVSPALSQFIYPPVYVVPPPPAETYVAPRARANPDKSKPAETPPPAKTGHYEGRTWVPD